MKRWMLILCAAGLGLVAPARADHEKNAFRKDTPVIVVGVVTSEPKSATNEHKMQVAIGAPEKHDYTLHFRGAALTGMSGEKVDEDYFDEGMWVRAEGRVMDDARRIKVTRLQVVAKDHPAFKKSAFFHPTFGHGYVTAVAGVRETAPPSGAASFTGAMPFVIVGKVSDDTGSFNRTRKIQVDAAGNTWTLHVPKNAMLRDARGKEISVHDVHKGQWVRAHGWRTADLRARVEWMENIGPQEAFRASTFYRTDFPFGYVDPIEGETAFEAYNVSGKVFLVDPAMATVHVRTADGKEHIIYTDAATMTRGGDRVSLGQVRVGDSITVEGRTIRVK